MDLSQSGSGSSSKNERGRKFSLFPRAQINEDMGGLLASPDIKRGLNRDLYTHVSSVRNPQEPVEWSDLKEHKLGLSERFFVNDYVAEVESINRISNVHGVSLTQEDVAVEASIKVMGETQTYYAHPQFIIRNRRVGRIPDEVPEDLVKAVLAAKRS